jgi:hypothetical protein
MRCEQDACTRTAESRAMRVFQRPVRRDVVSGEDEMTLIGTSACLCIVLLACSARATTPASICGEWTGSRPPKGTTRPNEQTWILTFRPDQSFSLGLVEGKTPVPGIEGTYKRSGTNVVIQLPTMPPVTSGYTITGTNLTIAFSRVTTMLGWGRGVESYVRTKTESQLKPIAKQQLLREGRYTFKVRIDEANEDSVLKDVFGEQYKARLDKPMEAGPYPLRHIQDKNILQLPGSQFGPPEFDGKTFKVFGAVAPKVNGEFTGTVVSSKKIKGTFKSRSTTLHGTFTLERTGAL